MKARKNIVETKITSPMVERRGEELQIISKSNAKP